MALFDEEEAERGLHRSHALEVMSEELADMQRADGGSEKGSLEDNLSRKWVLHSNLIYWL